MPANNPDSARERRLEVYRRYEARNRDRRVARCREYYEKNREAILARAKARRAGAGGDHMRAVQRAWRAANTERLLAQVKAAGYRAQKAWKRANLHKLREYTQRRSAREKATATEPVDYDAIWRESGGVCGICRDSIMVYDEIHFDHVVPLSKGGPHTRDNIQVAHAACNLKKHAKVIAA